MVSLQAPCALMVLGISELGLDIALMEHSTGRSCTALRELPAALMVPSQAPCALMVLDAAVLGLVMTVLPELGTALMVQVTARLSAVLTELLSALILAAGNNCALVVQGLQLVEIKLFIGRAADETE